MNVTVGKAKIRVLGVLLSVIMTFSVFEAFAIPVFAAPSVGVGTYAELRRAVENPEITYIYLTDDIYLGKETTYINTNRENLVIDGLNQYTIYDAETDNLSDTLRVKERGTIESIVVQNVEIIGRNHYGFITIPDSLLKYYDMQLVYSNVTYVGPQLVWARSSIIILENCNIQIVPGYDKEVGEVIEGLTIILSGTVNIVKDAPKNSDEIFLVSNDYGGITVTEGAVVNIENNQIQSKIAVKDSGFAHYGCEALYLTFENDSTFNYVGNNAFVTGDTIDRLIIGQRANVNVTTIGAFDNGDGQVIISNEMVIENDAIVNFIALQNYKKEGLLQMRDKAQLVINDPAHVLIYNSCPLTTNHGLAISAKGEKEVAVTYNDIKTLEYWRLTTNAPDELRQATYMWQNPDGSSWGLAAELKDDEVKWVTQVEYRGTYPITTNTLSARNVNVIRIKGSGSNPALNTVTFNANGGTPVPEPQTVPLGQMASEPAEPTREGYIFEGWYAAPDFSGAEWNFAADPVMNSMTLYAKWTATELSYYVAYYQDSVAEENLIDLAEMPAVPYGTAVELDEATLNAANPDPALYEAGVQVTIPEMITEDGQQVEVVYTQVPVTETEVIIEHFVQGGEMNGRPIYYLYMETVRLAQIGEIIDAESLADQDLINSEGYLFSHATYRAREITEVEVSENMMAIKVYYNPLARRALMSSAPEEDGNDSNTDIIIPNLTESGEEVVAINDADNEIGDAEAGADNNANSDADTAEGTDAAEAVSEA